MKKYRKYTVVVTTAAVIFCIALLVCLSVAAPVLSEMFGELRNLSNKVCTVILLSYYVCTLPALASLLCLLKILSNIRKDQPFKSENYKLMSVVSFCCIAVAAVTAFSGFYYMPLWFISAAMLFVFLIVRVVRGCFVSAFYIKEENNLTI